MLLLHLLQKSRQPRRCLRILLLFPFKLIQHRIQLPCGLTDLTIRQAFRFDKMFELCVALGKERCGQREVVVEGNLTKKIKGELLAGEEKKKETEKEQRNQYSRQLSLLSFSFSLDSRTLSVH